MSHDKDEPMVTVRFLPQFAKLAVRGLTEMSTIPLLSPQARELLEILSFSIDNAVNEFNQKKGA